MNNEQTEFEARLIEDGMQSEIKLTEYECTYWHSGPLQFSANINGIYVIAYKIDDDDENCEEKFIAHSVVNKEQLDAVFNNKIKPREVITDQCSFYEIVLNYRENNIYIIAKLKTTEQLVNSKCWPDPDVYMSTDGYNPN